MTMDRSVRPKIDLLALYIRSTVLVDLWKRTGHVMTSCSRAGIRHTSRSVNRKCMRDTHTKNNMAKRGRASSSDVTSQWSNMSQNARVFKSRYLANATTACQLYTCSENHWSDRVVHLQRHAAVFPQTKTDFAANMDYFGSYNSWMVSRDFQV